MIIEKNLALMEKRGEGGLYHLLLSESLGGNAGCHNGLSCAAANFFFDGETGEIKYFGNVQNVPDDIVEKYVSGCFRVALDLKSGSYEIVETCYDRRPSPSAKRTIDLSVAEFNRRNV